MSGTQLTLDDDQKFALIKFRRSVQDILQPKHTDQFLIRWLKARSWNAEAAEKMLRQSIKWRIQWEVDGALKEWTPPEAIRLYYPSGVCGFDKGGSPIIVVPFAGLDIVGLLHSVTRQDLIRTTIKIIENNLEMAAETRANSVFVIFDMEGFSLRQYAWRPAAEFIIALIQMYEANYPEILKACFIINAPRVFAIAFNIVKKFLNECTLAKIEIYKKEPKKWKGKLLEHISPDQLPKHFGGDLEDPDGDPRYITKINQGGKVPKSFYTKNLQIDENATSKHEYITTVIKKGDKVTLEYPVEEEGCFLRWDFKTEDHDIRFGITLKDADGNASPAVRHTRVSSHEIDESGVLACQAPATYTVTFDNSYSLLRNKKLHYCIYVTPPLKKMTILPTGEDCTEYVEDAQPQSEVEYCETERL
ncbi:SEC14-like protein 2 [Anthonomus grandis grandis]|uniref:SEC14-like protein 2 n=1 Tax=Anthonomus grandis grandis TaxID=2921223 RepID=UPI002165814E|nr:SEC14-like protein 2 [Anthonomus grandis grandis]